MTFDSCTHTHTHSSALSTKLICAFCNLHTTHAISKYAPIPVRSAEVKAKHRKCLIVFAKEKSVDDEEEAKNCWTRKKLNANRAQTIVCQKLFGFRTHFAYLFSPMFVFFFPWIQGDNFITNGLFLSVSHFWVSLNRFGFSFFFSRCRLSEFLSHFYFSLHIFSFSSSLFVHFTVNS